MNYRDRCACGEIHPDGVTPAMIARMKAYAAAHPDHQFAVDEEAGIIAVVIPRPSGGLQVLAHSHDLTDLLDRIGAPSAGELS